MEGSWILFGEEGGRFCVAGVIGQDEYNTVVNNNTFTNLMAREKLGIHLHDDEFLEKKPWDWENTRAEKYPLLLHYHPLVIYRHQVIKQADVILAMFLLGDEFTPERKKRNYLSLSSPRGGIEGDFG